jgi:hypothetical protein
MKKPDGVIRLCCYGVRFLKVFDLGLWRIFGFTHLAKEGFVECFGDMHAGHNQFVENWPDLGDEPTGLGFAQYPQASNDDEALAERFPSGFAFINEESGSLFFSQRDRLAFSQMEFQGQLINERAVMHGEVSNPRCSLHLCGSRFSSTTDHDLVIHGLGNREVTDDLTKELQLVGACE